jgi:hypothetical protein
VVPRKMFGAHKCSAPANTHSPYPETNSNTLVVAVAAVVEAEVAHRGKHAGHTSDTQDTHMGPGLDMDMCGVLVLVLAERTKQGRRNNPTLHRDPDSDMEWRG